MKRRRVDKAVEAVLADQPIPTGRLDSQDDVDALRAAIELKTAGSGHDEPDPAFVAGLRRRLAEDEPAARGINRRVLLAGAGAVAAGLAGVAVDRTLLAGDRGHSPGSQAAGGTLDPVDAVWTPVVAAAEVAAGGTKRFATAAAVGFVSDQGGTLAAVSGACTHQGCLLQLNQQAGRLDCPCHRTAFSTDGRLLSSQLSPAPGPLPTLQVRRQGDQIEVLLPKSP
jgi:cytochrome b6-f complex iron-sulfur subunit